MTDPDPPSLASLDIDIRILRGRNLIAKDRNMFGKKTSSDPYVKVYFRHEKVGKTSVAEKTLNPEWNEPFRLAFASPEANRIFSRGDAAINTLKFRIVDRDGMSGNDPMGSVEIPLISVTDGEARWYPVGSGSGDEECEDATGDLEIEISITARKMLDMKRGNDRVLEGTEVLRVGLSWEFAGEGTDLDASCVAVNSEGGVLMEESVYYGDLFNSNRSVWHSGDEREGDEDLNGTGDDEVITCDLSGISPEVLALYFILTVGTPDKSLEDVRSALVRVTNDVTKIDMFQFHPSLNGNHSALFLMRACRDEERGAGIWVLSIIDETDHTARDFGSLIPQIKAYSRDICPGILIDPMERIAVMRKGGAIRVNDYATTLEGDIPQFVTFGLAWNVTDGVAIDLDASAICLDESLALVDIIYFNHLVSEDGSVRHEGDERSGEGGGDDEKISVELDQVRTEVAYICFVINSFSGQELDDVKKTSCHLFNKTTGEDIARYTLSNCKDLDGHTALLMACLYRQRDNITDSSCDLWGDWCLGIMSQAAHGQTAKDNIDELYNHLTQKPFPAPSFPPDPEIVLNAMPETVQNDEEIVVPLFDNVKH